MHFACNCMSQFLRTIPSPAKAGRGGGGLTEPDRALDKRGCQRRHVSGRTPYVCPAQVTHTWSGSMQTVIDGCSDVPRWIAALPRSAGH